MPADSYRDAQLGIRARLSELARRIRERDSELSADFWDRLAPHLRERLEALREALDIPQSASFDQLARAEARLATYAHEIERLVAGLPATDADGYRAPGDVLDPPSEIGAGPALSPPEGEAFVQAFESVVREHDPSAEVEVEGWWSCLARFRHRAAPFALRCAALANGAGQLENASMHLVTSVPRGTPALSLRPERLLVAFGKALGSVHEIVVGDASFDGLFLIEGTRTGAARFLVPCIRAHLLSLARFDVPTLRVDPRAGIASLRWRFEPVAAALEAAIRVLTFIHETNAEPRFQPA